MRDVTLYEWDDGSLSVIRTAHPRERAVPAVVGITVAEIEADTKALFDAKNLNTALRAFVVKVRGERDEARAKLAEVEKLRQERDFARADSSELTLRALGEAEQERDRYREALERIAAFHHAPGKTYKAAWVESVRIAHEVLGMAQGAASSPDPMRDEPDSERDDAREEAREWARQFNRRRAREAVEAALPAGPVTADTEFVWIGGVPFVNATKHEAVVALRCAERDEARAEATRLRERELDDFTVTGDELDAALDRAEKAEQERDRYREALERIAEGESEHEWFFREDLRDVARAALGGGDD